MKETRRVSELMLERYRLGEVTPEERSFVDAELARDPFLSRRYDDLEASDAELRHNYPRIINSLKDLSVSTGTGKRSGSRKSVRILCAAAVLVCVLLPSVYYLRSRPAGEDFGVSGVTQNAADRLKGTEIKLELSVYLKESRTGTGEGRMLPDNFLLGEGSTVQLAYTAPPGDVYYGVIFSIDGRSTVTLHYPYMDGQVPVLVAGKRTFLDEAYTLDDTPDVEVFIMVVSRNPLDARMVLKTAHELASDPFTAGEKSAAAFDGCEVEVITIRK